MAGIPAKESSRDAAVYPAKAAVPKGFTMRFNAMKPRDTRDCCTPVGSPMRSIARKSSRSKRRSRRRVRSSSLRCIARAPMAKAIAWEITVAHAAPATPHPKHQDEEEVEDDVHQGRDDQEVERPLRVAEAAEHGAHRVVAEHEHHSREHDPQVGAGLRKDLIGRPHQAQDRAGGRQSHNAHDQRGEEENEDRRVPGPGELGVVPGAKELRQHHARPHRDAHHEGDHQEHDGKARANGRQGLLADEPADDDSVHRRVELLKHVAEQHREGEGDDHPGLVAFCEIGHAEPTIRTGPGKGKRCG